MNDEFGGDWDGFLKQVETATPTVEALGITDYCSIRGYQEFRRRWLADAAKNVKFVFPNVEFRLTVETERKKGINVHLLFSPADADHEAQIERLLGSIKFGYNQTEYRCVTADLQALGRACDASLKDNEAALRRGVSQFKVEFQDLRKLLDGDRWARENCLMAVAAAEGDGTAGLQRDSGFKAYREEIESRAQIILSGKPGDREYWLGKKSGFDREFIEKTYGSLKPCLHGSDAHRVERVLKPDEERVCWIRAELSFTGLKQTILEPEERVAIGREAPPGPSPSYRITRVEVSDAPWLTTPTIELNDGLVAIIGPKGSGKTALADILARAAGAEIEDKASFLLKAKELLGNAEAKLTWQDSAANSKPLKPSSDEFLELGGPPSVRYLSQQFVDRLCSAETLDRELLEVIEEVVFRSVPDGQRFGATNFADLRDIHLQKVRAARENLMQQIQQLSAAMSADEVKKAGKPAKAARADEVAALIKKSEDELAALVPKAREKEAEQLRQVQVALEAKTQRLQQYGLQAERLDELAEQLSSLRDSSERAFEDFKIDYQSCGVVPDEWEALRPKFAQDAGAVLAAAKARLNVAAQKVQAGEQPEKRTADLQTWSMADLQEKEKLLTQAIGLEAQRAKRHREVSERLVVQKRERDKLAKEIADADQADIRMKSAATERRKDYARIFEQFAREQTVLEQLYAPLKNDLAKGTPAKRALEFYVFRHVDLDSWIQRGEQLLDLRRAGTFQGRGKLKEQAEGILLPAWRAGGADAVGEAMQNFIRAHGEALRDALADKVSIQDVGRWLFSTDHITLEYGIRYDGVDISKLSPGMRGIVLLILYLAVDVWDMRPLIVDQPEENLDPQSVYEELVSYFRQAKRRRQVILVTHNPNLVVNADADQVIVARSERSSATALPSISYASGGLENDAIRKQVCRVLEGGERAFVERQRRYNLPQSSRGLAA